MVDNFCVSLRMVIICLVVITSAHNFLDVRSQQNSLQCLVSESFCILRVDMSLTCSYCAVYEPLMSTKGG